MDEEFLKRLNKNYNYDNNILDIAQYLSSLKPFNIPSFNPINEDELLDIIKDILKRINNNYYLLFNKMYNEQNCNNPVIYTLTSNNNILENESNTINNEIFFYKTNTYADIYLLLHEFTHYLVNRNNSYLNDYNKKRYDEVLPILIEFIISNILNNNNYIKIRINKSISYSKSILAKHEIGNGNYDINKLFNKYNFNKEEIISFKTDLLYSKSLDYNEELRYIYGFLYAYYYSDNSINNYKFLLEEYTNNRNILIPTLNKKKIFNCIRI